MTSDHSEYECGYRDGRVAGTMMALAVYVINAVGR